MLTYPHALAGGEAGGYWLDLDILPFMWVFLFFSNAEEIYAYPLIQFITVRLVVDLY